MSPRFALVCLLLAGGLNIAPWARADHGFSQFGSGALIVAPGEGVELRLGGHQESGVTDPSVAFHLRLFFNEEAPSGPPALRFSEGDVLRLTLGGTSVIYQFDDPTNILGPTFLSFGFFDANNIDDIFGEGDPIGLAFAASDGNGEILTLEVLAGDGVRFSGMEIADLDAGTFQKCGASTFVRRFSIDGGNTAAIDFDELSQGAVVSDQYLPEGVTFFGDIVYDEQFVVDKLGSGIGVIDSRFLLNASATPPLGRSKFIGLSLERPAHALRFDFATPSASVRVAGFQTDFTPGNLQFVEEFFPAAGPSGLFEGSASVVHPAGFDQVILPMTTTLLLDHVEVTYRRIAEIDFEGFHTGTELESQLAAIGVTFFGDSIGNESDVIQALGRGFDRLEGNFLVNDTATPPTGKSGMIGFRLDRLASRVSFDFAGPSPLRVVAFRGAFAPGNIVGVLELTTTVGASGFSEGHAVVTAAAGFDGVILAESHDGLVLDNLTVEYLEP